MALNRQAPPAVAMRAAVLVLGTEPAYADEVLVAVLVLKDMSEEIF